MTFESFSQFEDDAVFEDACQRGSHILTYSKIAVKKISERAVMRIWEGKRIYIVNSSQWMSEIGSKLSPNCDFVVVWYFDHRRQQYGVSLRSFHEEVDCSEIAKRFGGGGHKKAAGFSLSKKMHIDDVFASDIAKDVISKELKLQRAHSK